MRDANLSLRQVDTYLKHLMVSGLIRATDPIESQEIARYRLTEKGFLMARDAARWRHLIGHRPRTI
jgi:predicted transcriptional regulator